MSPPPVIVTPERVDFGRVAEGIVVEKTVRLRNTGKTPLAVGQVHSSCGCTTTQAPLILAPGTDAPLTVRFNSRDRVGDIHQSVSVSFSNGTKAPLPPLTLETAGTVTREVALSAKSLDLGSRDDASASLTVARLDKQPLTVSPQNVPASLQVTVSPNGPDSAAVRVTRRGPRVAGVREEEVTLGLNHPLLPTVTVPVRWENASAYQVAPPSINFGAVKPAATLLQSVRVSLPAGYPLSNFRVLSAPPGWQAHVTPLPSDKRVALVSLRGSLRKETLLHSRLVLATGNPREPEIIIPIYAAANAGSSDVCTSDVPAKSGSR